MDIENNVCDRCGEIGRDSIKVINEDMESDWCPYCVGNYAYNCHACGSLASKLISTSRGDYVCEQCFEGHYCLDCACELEPHGESLRCPICNIDYSNK
jgi:hypothetical protein